MWQKTNQKLTGRDEFRKFDGMLDRIVALLDGALHGHVRFTPTVNHISQHIERQD